MKLTGDLKKKVEESASRETKKAVIAQAGMELTDDELDKVAGGADGGGVFYLYECTNEITFHNGTKGVCGKTFLTNFSGAACPREECGCTDVAKRILIQSYEQ